MNRCVHVISTVYTTSVQMSILKSLYLSCIARVDAAKRLTSSLARCTSDSYIDEYDYIQDQEPRR